MHSLHALSSDPASGAGRNTGARVGTDPHMVPRSHGRRCLLTPSLVPHPAPVLVEPLSPGHSQPHLGPDALWPQVMDQKLSGQRAALERGQNPLPLYLSLNVKENNLETLDFKGTVLPTPPSSYSTLQILCTPRVPREFTLEALHRLPNLPES